MLASIHEVTVMDGSMGRQLCLHGMPQDDLFKKVWSARALVDKAWHTEIIKVHRKYIETGAKIILTNSYGVQPTYYRRIHSEEEWEKHMLKDAELAASLAVQARKESNVKGVRIFGCLPPLCESHRPDLFQKFLKNEGEDFIIRIFRALAKAALKGGADALILENMVCWEEAELGLKACKDLNAPIIVSLEGALRDLSLQPQTHLSPEIVKNILHAAKNNQHLNIEALGFSCTEPETILECFKNISPALHSELQQANIKLSAHANCNDRKEAHSKGFDVSSDKSEKIQSRTDLVNDEYSGYVKFCKLFVEHGASYVGGCCGCGPDGIEKIIEHFKSMNQMSTEHDVKDEDVKKIAILGCGAMGSIYATHLAATTTAGNNEIWAVDVWEKHIETINKKGLELTGPKGKMVAKTIHATSDFNSIGDGTCDLVIIATKASGVREASKVASKLLKKETGLVLCIQNGLPSVDAIGEFIEADNILLGVATNFGAGMKSPGHAEYKNLGSISIGKFTGGFTKGLQQVVDIWENAGFEVKLCNDIQKLIWQKFIINCANSATCTITGFTVGEMMDNEHSIKVALNCAREADAVARAKGINLDFSDVEKKIRAFNSTVRGAKPSMLQDYERKRKSEIRVINGAVAVEAGKVGLAAPVNETVASLVLALEAKF